VAQENKQLKDQLEQLQEQMELTRFRPPVVPQPQQAQNQDFDSLFIQNPKQAVATVASQAVQKQIHAARIAEVLEEENAKNPNEYQERLSYANQISQQFPQLVTSPTGVRKLFQLADKYRRADYQNKGMAFVKAVMGEDVDFEKFKSMVKKDQAPTPQNNNYAYMPDNSIPSRSGSESGKQTSAESDVQAAVKKGDPDAVIHALFKERGLR
jgi:hypothetical protein